LAEYGFIKALEIAALCILNYETAKDRIQNTDKTDGKRAKTVRQVNIEKRKKFKVRGVTVAW